MPAADAPAPAAGPADKAPPSLPPLPADPYLSAADISTRRAEMLVQISQSGSQAWSSSTDPAGLGDDDPLLLNGAGGTAWAIYRFDHLLPEDLPALATLHLSGSLPSRCWTAYPDYSKGCWKFVELSVLLADNDIAVLAGPQTLSPAGSLYFAVLVRGEDLSVARLDLLFDTDIPPAPLGLTAQSQKGDRIHLGWDDPALSFDPDGPGPRQFQYQAVGVYRSSLADGPYELLGTVPAGTTAFDDFAQPQDLEPGGPLEPAYGETRYYRLQTVTLLAPGRLGSPVGCARQVAQVEGLSASDGVSGTEVRLDWTAQPDAAYLVEYRATEPPGSPYLSLGQSNDNHFVATDLDLIYGETYEFQVLAIHGEDRAPPSNPDEGYMQWPPLQNLQASQGEFDDYIQLSWDPVPGATSYRVFIRESGSSHEQSLELFNVLSWNHDALQQPPSEFNVLYEYEVCVNAPHARGPRSATVSGYRNWKPVAALSGDPYYGPPPLTVTLDASESVDFSGAGITEYHWDFDGDGSTDFNTGAGVSVVQHNYTSVGVITPQVTVVNSEGETSLASTTIFPGGWIHTWGTNDHERSALVAEDSSGNSYHCGFNLLYNQFLLAKYDATGRFLWIRSWTAPNGWEATRCGLSADAAGVLVACFSPGLLLRFNADGSLAWSRVWQKDGLILGLNFSSLCQDSLGRAYLTGYMNGTPSYVVCVEPDGAVLWTREFEPGVRLLQIRCLGTALWTLGVSQAASYKLHLCKLDTSGNMLWQREQLLSSYPNGMDLAAQADGDCYVAACGIGAPGWTQIYRIDSSGGLLWARELSLVPHFDALLTCNLAVNTQGKLILAGYYGARSACCLFSEDGQLLRSLYTKNELIAMCPAADGSIFLSGGALSNRLQFQQIDALAQPISAQFDATNLGLAPTSTTLEDISGSLGAPSGFLDTGAGGWDMLALKFKP